MVRYKSLDFMGFPSYRVGEDGTVWSYRMNRQGVYRWKLLKGSYTRKGLRGYRSVKLSNKIVRGKPYLFHYLVLVAFVGPRPHPKWEGCHNDGDYYNNRLTNLRWDTAKNNQADRMKHGTSLVGRRAKHHGESCSHSVLTAADVRRIRRLYSHGILGRGYKSLGRKFGVHWATIREIVTGRSWKYTI